MARHGRAFVSVLDFEDQSKALQCKNLMTLSSLSQVGTDRRASYQMPDQKEFLDPVYLNWKMNVKGPKVLKCKKLSYMILILLERMCPKIRMPMQVVQMQKININMFVY